MIVLCLFSVSEHDDFDDDLDIPHSASNPYVHSQKLEGLRGKDLGECDINWWLVIELLAIADSITLQ